MNLDGEDPVTTALRLVAVVLGLATIALGVRVAGSRRFPAAWVRLARLTPSQRSQPVRMGSAQAMIGAGVVFQQAPFLFSVPYPVGVALFVVSLLSILAAAGSFALLRR
ncbi:hypothetical protein KBX06_23615 [Micromonospora sp. C31]|uniref:hypothetical protein n=1 Tax=Micromonospora sp. C31 TaxID=2824876 RepID=UPI001B39616C|nr:hypothetical protein [Micromonospora sp. C31]MBQ1076120.1 hypothetical protein [Micromonospora sp. C31]